MGGLSKPDFLLAILLLLVIILIYCWDAYAMASGQPNESVSALLQKWSSSQPVLPFAVGFLLGHLFW